MKLIKSILVILLLQFGMFDSHAQEVSLAKVKEIGNNFFELVLKKNGINAMPVIGNVQPITDNGTVLYYVVSFRNGGYVFVSADYRSKPVLGFSPNGTFTADDLPDGYKHILNGYNRSITKVKGQRRQADSVTSMRWKSIELKQRPRLKSTEDDGVVERPPLLTCHWYGAGDWNNQCPGDFNGEQASAGCVAVSMAQTIYYHKFPSTGYGAHSYNSPLGPLSVDFGAATYNYSQMADNYPTSESEKLLYHCGVAVDMGYGDGASGASMTDMTSAFNNYFRFIHPEISVKTDYSDEEWDGKMKAHLDHLLPVPYSGIDDDPVTIVPGEGHAWVIDGYDVVYYETFYHCNFGWAGGSDNYFLLDAIKDPGHLFNFTSDQLAVFFVIKPTNETSYNVSSNVISQYLAKYLSSTSTLSSVVDLNSAIFLQTSSNILMEPGFKVESGGKFYARYGFINESAYGNENRNVFYSEPRTGKNNELSIYPNPSNGLFTLRDDSPVLVQIYTLNGQLIFSKQFQSTESIIDISKHPSGLYIVKLNDSQGQTVRKITKF